MLKRKWFKPFKITPAIAGLFIYIGAGTAFILAALSTPLFFRESPAGWLALPDTIILLLGGWGILKGNRMVSVILPAYMLASRYVVNETFGRPWLDVRDFVFFPGYALGMIGTFGHDRAERITAGLPDKRWLDKNIAGYFTLLAGLAGLCFGAITGIFSIWETGPYTHYNIADALLITCFAWYTLKRRLWAAGSQVILNLLNVTLSYLKTGDLGSIFGFLPLFLLEVFILGFIGVAALCGQRQEELESM